VREGLGHEGAEDDDVKGGDVRADRAVFYVLGPGPLRGNRGPGAEGNRLLVEGDWASVEGENEVSAMRDGLVEESERRG
jgi:hypothetical protein